MSIPYLEEKNEMLGRITDCALRPEFEHSTVGECIHYPLPLCCLSGELVYRPVTPAPARKHPRREPVLLLVWHRLREALEKREHYGYECIMCSHIMEGSAAGNVGGLEEFGGCVPSSVSELQGVSVPCGHTVVSRICWKARPGGCREVRARPVLGL